MARSIKITGRGGLNKEGVGQMRGGLSKEEVEQMKRDAEIYAEEDRKFKELTQK